MTLRYVQRSINIDIFIPVDDIDSTDIVSVYDIDDPSSGIGTFLDDTLGVLEDPEANPSIGDTFRFRIRKNINTPRTYFFFYTVRDQWGNESEPISFFEVDACLTPIRPDAVAFDELDFATGSKAEQDLSSGLFAQLKMNDNDDDTVVYDNIETLSAVYVTENTEDKSVSGKIDRALSFDGSTDYIDTNDKMGSVFQNSFSLNIWVKPVDATPASHQYLLGVSDFAGEAVELYLLNTDITFEYNAGANTAATSSVATGFSDNTWHMITVTLEELSASEARLKMYIDGTEVSDSGTLGNIWMEQYVPLFDLYLGAINGVGTENDFLEGALDNFTIWTKILTEDEIAVLWNEGAGTEQNPVDLVDEFFTLSHTDLDTLVETTDGNYPTNTTTFFIDQPPVALYDYVLTATDVPCGTTSADSIALSIDFRPPSLIPLNDINELKIARNVDGSFILTWRYTATTDRVDPITNFNIYFNNNSDPSTGLLDPSSGEGYILDGSTLHNTFSAKFQFTTSEFPDGTFVEWKVVPAVEPDGSERDLSDNQIVGEIADSIPPIVTDDFIETTVT